MSTSAFYKPAPIGYNNLAIRKVRYPMKKRLLAALAALALTLAGCAPAAPAQSAVQASSGGDALHVLATTYPVYLFTTAVTEGVDGVEVSLLVNAQTSCLHDYTLTTTDMKAVEQADLIVMNGVGLEAFMDDALAQSGAPVIDCSQGIELLPYPAWDGHGHAEEGGEYDPHIWMSPDNAVQMMQNIRDGLSQRLPGAEARMTDNVTRADTRLAQELPALSDAAARYGLITFHDGFQYFARDFGLNLLKSIEEEEGSEASAADIKEIVSLIGANGLPTIFTEKNGSSATADAIARETGVQVRQLDMIMSGDGSGLQPYLDAMNANLSTLAEAFQ